MGIFKRVKTIALADMHAALDKAENPVSMVKQYIRELEEQLVKANQAVAQQIATEKKFEQLVAETEAVVEKRLRQASLAAERGEDEVARLALQEKIAQEQKLAAYKKQYEAAQAQTANVKGKVQELHEKYEALKVKQHEIIARVQAAEAVHSVQATVSTFGADNAVSGFARIEERIWALEAEVQVQDTFTAPLQAKVNPLLQAEIEEQLQALKAGKN